MILRNRRAIFAGLVVGCCVCRFASAQESPEQSELQENVESHRIQVDVSVEGPREALASLGVEDLTVRAGLKKVETFTLDRLCQLEEESVGVAPSTQTSYLFYFDQTQLTLQGRKRSISLARELIPRLATHGSRVALVSNGRSLQIVSDWSTDPEALEAALTRLEKDFTQFDNYASQEQTRVADVAERLETSQTIQQAISRARVYEREETYRARKSFQRIRSVLDRFSEYDPPRVLVLFADHLRSNAGEHYTRFFGESLAVPGGTLATMRVNVGATAAAFDSLIHDLIISGIRLYAIESDGFSIDSVAESPSPGGQSRAGRNAPSSIGRARDSRQTMSSLASETGGRSYTQNSTARQMVDQIGEDLECIFLVGFDAGRFSADTVHSLKITSRDPRVQLRYRGRFINTSAKTRLRSQLLSAFLNPKVNGNEKELAAYMIPLGFDNGRWRVLLQIQIAGSPTARTSWDLGASLLRADRILEERSRHIELDAVGVPAAFESEISFKPGAVELLAVAHEAASNLVLSGSTRQDWKTPYPGSTPPVQILQPRDAIMIRDEQTRLQGLWVLGKYDPLDPRRSAAFIGVACRGKSGGDGWSVERQIEGRTVVSFPSVPLDNRKEPCLQIRDLAPPTTLGPGDYIYRIQITHHGEVLSTRQRSFSVLPTVQAEEEISLRTGAGL